MDALGCFFRGTSKVSFFSSIITSLLDVSNIFIALLIFRFPYSVCFLIFIKYFMVVFIKSSLEIVLPLNRSSPICPSFHRDNILFEVSAFSFDFELKEAFWSNIMGKINSAFIISESCFVVYVQQFPSLVISSITSFATDPEGNK